MTSDPRSPLRSRPGLGAAGLLLPAAAAVLLAALGYGVSRATDHAGLAGKVGWLSAGLLLAIGLLLAYRRVALTGQRGHSDLHDHLTGLPNRAHLLGRIERAVSQATGRPGSVGLFVLDLDRFREVNDTLGHQVGDQLLTQVARRLESVVRPGDSVARLGGDEFAVLLSDVPGVAAAEEVAIRVVATLMQPFEIDGCQLDLEASLGIALFPQHAADVATLLQRADVAMYLAKETRDGFETYTPARHSNSPARLSLLGRLRRALDDGELEVHYQPKAQFSSGDVVGVEALVRWRHPDRGLLGPEEFVPLAEETGLMRPLTEYVVEAALADAARWRADGINLRMAINISARDLHGPALAVFLESALRRHGVPAQCIQLEITEGSLMRDPARAAMTLRTLAALGVSLSLDDFGTGYSSLAHLRRLPVHEIKIDKSFVSRMTVDHDDATIVRSIIDLGAALGLRVVAEGVENARTWDRLGRLGCDDGQGWYLSKAMPAADITVWLEGTGGNPRAVSAAAAPVLPRRSRPA